MNFRLHHRFLSSAWRRHRAVTLLPLRLAAAGKPAEGRLEEAGSARRSARLNAGPGRAGGGVAGGEGGPGGPLVTWQKI